MVFSAEGPSDATGPTPDMPDYGEDLTAMLEIFNQADQSPAPSTPLRAEYTTLTPMLPPPEISFLPSLPTATASKMTPFKAAVINPS